MNVVGVKRSVDWDFGMPDYLREDIDKLVDAMASDSIFLDCYQDNLEGSARGVAQHHDDELRKYYLEGGWHADVAS